MEKQQILDFVSENKVNKDSIILITYNEGDNEVTRRGKIQFYDDGRLGLSNDLNSIGVSVEYLKETAFRPLSSLSLTNIISLQTI